ncbi:Integrase [Legionella steelei]|uniref:Integrase n=1 Tax=Legionella steelei TaxID=947033 RepID=A0A0W0ZC99_9GAMM|nr:Integrase [Legionella steelei]
MRKALNALGYPVGRRRTQSLMKEAEVFVRYRKKYKVTTNSKHKQPVYENVLNRQFHEGFCRRKSQTLLELHIFGNYLKLR